jgi:hypothetical protein
MALVWVFTVEEAWNSEDTSHILGIWVTAVVIYETLLMRGKLVDFDPVNEQVGMVLSRGRLNQYVGVARKLGRVLPVGFLKECSDTDDVFGFPALQVGLLGCYEDSRASLIESGEHVAVFIQRTVEHATEAGVLSARIVVKCLECEDNG